jgi:hypothetical protein
MMSRGLSKLPLVIVRIPKRIAKQWISRHERDGLDEYKLSVFLKLHYELQHYERTQENLLLFTMHFQKRGGQPMKANLWVRERKINDLIELILIRGHAERL